MLGIVILNYKNYNETLRCIDNIFFVKIDEAFIIYVVDNASPNESYSVLSKTYHNKINIKVIQSGKNGGFSFGNNVGFRAAIEDGCDKILCTNSDVEFKEDSIYVLCKDMDEHTECAVIGPKVLCHDGSIQNATRRILTPRRFLMRHKPFSFFDWLGIEKKYSYGDYKYDKPTYIEGMVSGCCFMMRASAIVRIGYLDENVFLYHEENILAAKLRKAGYKVMLNPKAEIIHFGGKSTGGNTAFIRYNSFYSALYYFWFYSETSRASFNLIWAYIKCVFLFKSLFDGEYKTYYKKLKSEIKKMKKCRRDSRC